MSGSGTPHVSTYLKESCLQNKYKFYHENITHFKVSPVSEHPKITSMLYQSDNEHVMHVLQGLGLDCSDESLQTLAEGSCWINSSQQSVNEKNPINVALQYCVQLKPLKMLRMSVNFNKYRCGRCLDSRRDWQWSMHSLSFQLMTDYLSLGSLYCFSLEE